VTENPTPSIPIWTSSTGYSLPLPSRTSSGRRRSYVSRSCTGGSSTAIAGLNPQNTHCSSRYTDLTRTFSATTTPRHRLRFQTTGPFQLRLPPTLMTTAREHGTRRTAPSTMILEPTVTYRYSPSLLLLRMMSKLRSSTTQHGMWTYPTGRLVT
jgi:hypothetical protein